MTGALLDPGLQPERTELAWRRTSLSLALGSLVGMRLLPEAFGSGWWGAPGILGVLFAVFLWRLSRRRYEQSTSAAVLTGEHATGPDGALLAALGVFVTLTGALAIAVVLALAVR